MYAFQTLWILYDRMPTCCWIWFPNPWAPLIHFCFLGLQNQTLAFWLSGGTLNHFLDTLEKRSPEWMRLGHVSIYFTFWILCFGSSNSFNKCQPLDGLPLPTKFVDLLPFAWALNKTSALYPSDALIFMYSKSLWRACGRIPASRLMVLKIRSSPSDLFSVCSFSRFSLCLFSRAILGFMGI